MRPCGVRTVANAKSNAANLGGCMGKDEGQMVGEIREEREHKVEV